MWFVDRTEFHIHPPDASGYHDIFAGVPGIFVTISRYPHGDTDQPEKFYETAYCRALDEHRAHANADLLINNRDLCCYGSILAPGFSGFRDCQDDYQEWRYSQQAKQKE